MVSVQSKNSLEEKVDVLIAEKEKVSTLIEGKHDFIISFFSLNVSLFAPMGAIYMVIGSFSSYILFYIIGVLLLFWGTISYLMISIKDKIKKNQKFKLID